MKMHITPGYNGWAPDAKRISRAIAQKELEKYTESKAVEHAVAREQAELAYYDDNHCYPCQTGYFGTETDAHFYER